MSDVIANARTELVRIAAELVTGRGYPSEFCEDHPPKRDRAYWLSQLEMVDQKNKAIGMRIKAVNDMLKQGPTPGDRHE